jgi:hypothetical protein
MVLSKASFFHRKYLDLYTNQMAPSIRDYVTENRYNSIYYCISIFRKLTSVNYVSLS